jgi:hypothetical protein
MLPAAANSGAAVHKPPDTTRSREFVRSAHLPPPPPALRSAAEAGTADEALQAGKAQAAVVGSDVVSFATNVAPQWRQDLINCSLFAQLWAKAEVPDSSRIFDWYSAYFGALQQLGWMVQDQGFAVYVETSQNFSAHQAILKVAEGLLMPSMGSLALVKTTLDALASMDESSPFITLFSRESQQASAARFQISLAEQAADGGLTVALMAFGLEAKTTLTQVLFFKSQASQATLRHCSGKVSVNTPLLEALRPDLSEQLKDHARSFIRKLPSKLLKPAA